MNFNNLTTVSEQLYIGSIIPPPDPNIPNMYTDFSYTSDVYAAYHGIDIAFPALTSAMAIDFWGNISRSVLVRYPKYSLNGKQSIDGRTWHCRSAIK
jgi:hypothetical protein